MQVFSEEVMDVGDPLCSICYEDFADGVMVRKLNCKHLFHAKCVEEWLQSVARCPLCNLNPFAADDISSMNGSDRPEEISIGSQDNFSRVELRGPDISVSHDAEESQPTALVNG